MEPITSKTETRLAQLQTICSGAREQFYARRRYGQQVAIYRQALTEFRQLLGTDDATVAHMIGTASYLLYSWALRCHNKEKRHRLLQDAQVVSQEQLRILERIGATEQEQALAYLQAAYPYAHDKDCFAACILMEAAIDIVGTKTVAEFPMRRQLPHMLGHLGGFYLDAGDYLKAVEVMQQALSTLEQDTGSKVHEDSYYMYQRLARAAKKLGDQIEKRRNANHPSKVEQAKNKFSQLYLGKNGINAVSAEEKPAKLLVYADNAQALNGIPNPFEGFALELQVSPQARLAARTNDEFVSY